MIIKEGDYVELAEVIISINKMLKRLNNVISSERVKDDFEEYCERNKKLIVKYLVAVLDLRETIAGYLRENDFKIFEGMKRKSN